MRKTTSSILLATLVSGTLFGLLSCSSGGDKNLEIKTQSPSAYLIPAATASCKSRLAALTTGDPLAADISSKYFTVRGLKFTWNHAYNSLSIALIRLRFTSDGVGGTYTCDISGDELTSLKYDTTTFIPWTGSIAATGNYNSKTTVETTCDLRCGGVTAQDTSFRASGRIQVIGFMTAPDGEQFPVNESAPFSIENLK